MLIKIPASRLLLLGLVSSALALDPLEQVERDQARGQLSSHNIFNRNIALNSMREFTHVSSYKRGAFGFYAHDGDEKTAWIVDPEERQAFLQVSWGLAVPINQIRVQEKAGENIQALKLELYSGTHWETLAPDSDLERGRFTFATRPASALRISIEINGEAGGIAEVEVYNTESATPLGRYGSADLIAAMEQSDAVILLDGSPYAYSRSGRKLITSRAAEACLADLWTQPVLERICMELGGQAELVEDDRLTVSLNGQTFTIDASHGVRVVDQIERLAQKAQMEFLRRGALIMVGRGLAALDNDKAASDLGEILGRNPYLISGRSKAKADAIVTPTLSKEGITYEWAGFRSTAYPDTNIDAWLKYSETKAIRSWVNAARYMNMYIRPARQVESAEDFEHYMDEIRANPETNSIVAMRAFLNKHHEDLSGEFGICNALGINVINETGPKHWPDTLHDDFIQWASTYTLTYYLAKNFGVEAHQFGNEPDWYFEQSTEEQILRRLTLVADAIHSAIEDVNRDHGRNLQSVYAAPVLAGNYQGRSARIMMRNLDTRYDGTKSATRLFQLFNRHRYSGRPHQNALEVRQAKQMMQEEAGEVLPQVFTELNYSTGRNWKNASFDNDTPAVFTSIAAIWGWMMQEQGVHGIFVFKLNSPGIWSWKDTGRFSNTITHSMHPEQDSGAKTNAQEQISYGSKNFEVCRLFGRGFHGSRPLLKTEIDCSDLQYRSWTTFDEEDERFYIWSVQPNDFMSYELEFDLSQLDLPADALVTAETVSGARHGEVTQVITLPKDQKIRLHQAPQSAMLVTVHKRKVSREVLYPTADAAVIQGNRSQANLGAKKGLGVARNANNNSNIISFLKFKLPEGADPTQRAILELHGHSHNRHAYDSGFLFRVYAIEDNNWQELAITADNAPNVYKTVSGLKTIDLNNYPVGHATCYNTPSKLRVDITRAVQEAQASGRDELSLVLIREIYWPDENTDASRAVIASREAGEESGPKVFVWK
ncbi:MAG: DNRLRE domain-containing protein [Kiritimatiellae bacterium]|nr:DNRLRE domain-containing protein [Kiritimatiellia bacterium]